MKWTALLAVMVMLVAADSANAAPVGVKGTVVAKRAHSRTVVLATGRRGLAVTVRVSPGGVRLGDRVSVVGTRLRDGTIRASRLHIVSHGKKARIRGMVVRRLAHSLRVASGHSVLTIHTSRGALASRHDGQQAGDMGEFEVEFEHRGLVEDDFTPPSP